MPLLTTSSHGCRRLFVFRKVLRLYTTDATDSSLLDKTWTLYQNGPQHIDIEKSSVFLFPGQGAQFVGMGKDLLDVPKTKHMFQYANETLRTNLLKTCLEGPQSKLNETIHCQPATYIVSLAAVAKLQATDEELVRNCVAAAGFSVGEVAALVFSGAMTFEQGLRVVRVRAESMQRACESPRGAMLSVFVNHDSQLKLALQAAINHCEMELRIKNPECRIANYLYSDCKVIAGNVEAIEFIENHMTQFNIPRVKRLPLSGAFHTRFMESATRPLYNVLSRLESLSVPKFPVISNVDVLPYRSAHNIRRKLSLQVVRPVRWEQVLHAMYSRPPDAPFPRTIEPGPGRQLGTMLRVVNRKAFARYQSIEV
ncbi:unnamed protein product [Dicrocoelium dendriticum]|nr:unnamed protein product [Dicrocoelium dendriticum]